MKPYEVIPTAPDLSPREQEREDRARQALGSGAGVFYDYRGRSGPYYGEVRFPHLAPNVSGVFYVKRDALEIQPTQPQAPRALLPQAQPGPGSRPPAETLPPGHLGPLGPQTFEGPPGSREGQPTTLPGVGFKF